jgi:hypothetical protein
VASQLRNALTLLASSGKPASQRSHAARVGSKPRVATFFRLNAPPPQELASAIVDGRCCSLTRTSMWYAAKFLTRSATHMSDEDLKAELEKLRAENERLKSQRGRSVSLKVSEKGGVSVYGLGRFPVTLYKEQWAKLLAMTDEIKAFLKEHDAELKAKPDA